MLNPSDSIVDWVLEMVPKMGAGWCPPGMLGIGIGGTAEKAMVMAKESLMETIDMAQLLQRGPQTDIEKLSVEIYEKVNAIGISWGRERVCQEVATRGVPGYVKKNNKTK